jgi:ABC-type transport system substrate-binding protein
MHLSFSKLKHLLIPFKKWPSKSQWGHFFHVLNRKEKITFFVFLSLFLISSIFLSINFYFNNTKIIAADGGTLIEGINTEISRPPRFINPVLANSDTDRDLTELIYSGLMKYDEEGKIIPDLAKNFPQISEDGKIYEFDLKDNVFWQDGKPITADDVIFTVNTIQNPDYKSSLRVSWLGIEVEKISDKVLRFKLKDPYNSFLETTTLKILPKHIWQNISLENFLLSVYNLKPIGSGPFKVKEIKQDDSGAILSVDLVKNQRYYGEVPHLDKISFRFFKNEDDLIKAAKRGEIQGFNSDSVKNYSIFEEKGFLAHQLSLPRYFSVFFNPNPPAGEPKILDEKEIRQTFNYGTNKKEILEKIFLNQGEIVDSPILPELYGFNNPPEIYDFNIEKAKELLDEAGFVVTENGQREKVIKKEAAFKFKSTLKVGSNSKEVEELQRCLSQLPEIYPEGQITGVFGEKTKTAVINFQEKYLNIEGTGTVGSSTRKKLNEVCFKSGDEIISLKFSLTTIDQPALLDVASLLKEQWQKLGIEIEINKIDPSKIEDIIKKREYELLLFGEILGSIPDPFPFWHSSQKNDPGLNLALYENKDVDKLLKEARQTLDEAKRKEDLEKFQDILIGDAPAVFLYSPTYIYFVSKKIKVINAEVITDSSKRFIGIENWYLKTKRAWK